MLLPGDADPLLDDPAGINIDPSRVRGNRVFFLAIVTSIGGLLFGFDTGVISGALPYLRDDAILRQHLASPSRLVVVQESIVSAAIVAAAAGSAAGGWLADAAGRRTALLLADILFAVGSACMAAAAGVPALLAGRVLVGLGVGLASVTAPVFIAECAPPKVRASLVTLNVLAITSGQLLAYASNYAFSFVPGTWRWMLGIAALPAIAQLCLLCFLPESPSWLAGRGRAADARRAAVALRLPAADKPAGQPHISDRNEHGGSAWRVLLSPPVRSALHVGVGLQVLQQLAGINTVMYYAPTIIQLAGFHDNRTALLISLLPAAVNTLGTVAGMLCIDRYGRRRLLLASVAAVVLALAALGGAFRVSELHSPVVAQAGSSCRAGSCAACLRAGCGFCDPSATCLRLGGDAEATCAAAAVPAPGQPPSTTLYVSGCPSAYGAITLALLMVYLAAFSPGLGPVPWAVNSEIYPLQVRGLATGIAATANWLTNAAVAQTFLTLTHALGSGAFWLYAGAAFLGGAWAWAWLPETKGLALEDVQELFRRRAGVGPGSGGAEREVALSEVVRSVT